MAQKTKWTALLDRIAKIMAAKQLTVADVAKAIGRGDQYNQVYNWLTKRSHEPKAEVALTLHAWADANEGETYIEAKEGEVVGEMLKGGKLFDGIIKNGKRVWRERVSA